MISSYKNYEWYLENDFSKYSGKWLAIIDKKVVGVNKDVEKLVYEVKDKYPKRRPLISKVRSKLSIL
ncbi:DUF5678 domain-containing protein [Nanoarchaeota archaeon]